MEDQQKAAAITRRSLALATLAAGAVSLTAQAEAGKPVTFVLVHGAWHGGWCWDRVGALLRARGHVVYTPTLTGLADRSHLFSADINLSR